MLRRKMVGLITVSVCLGFLLCAAPAAADVTCPDLGQGLGNWELCENSGSECTISWSGCDYDKDGWCDSQSSPNHRPQGVACTGQGGVAGQCDGSGSCVISCDDIDEDGLCDDQSTCYGSLVAADTDSSLCWTQTLASKKGPGVDTYQPWTNADVYCNDLVEGGYDDWRLPTIDELRTIIVDCPSQELGGSCQVSDPTCLDSSSCLDECYTCSATSSMPSMFTSGPVHDLWSASPVTNQPGYYWQLADWSADIYPVWATQSNYDEVRCVRDWAPAGGTGGPTQEVISDSTPGDSWNHHIFNVEPGSQFSVAFETHSGAAFYFVEWDQPGGFGGNQCYKHVPAGQTDSCSNLTVAASATEAYVSVRGLQSGVDYTITVDYVAPGGTSCPDADGDGVCDADDICPGFDDSIDVDFDGTPDGCDGCPSDGNKLNPGVCGCGVADDDSDLDGVMDCNDICPLDNPDDPDGNGICGDQGSVSGCSGPGVAEDAANGLCWMYDTAPGSFNSADATSYCENLMLDGYDDWRLPTIDELRMILEGCPSQEYGGSCGVTDPGCLDGTCDDVGCSTCSWGDYLAPFLGGSIETTISSSDDGSGLNWAVRYVNAYVFRRGSASANTVRCVRDSAAVGCTDSDGDGVCDADDICPGFDDLLDADGDGTPDDCDICPFDNPDDPDGNGICGDQGSLPSCTGPNVVEDPASGLCWQDPEHTDWLTQAGAASYCDNLVLDGYDNWRLPTIGETRTIIQNCPVQQAGGACGITDSCLHRTTCDAGSCTWCSTGGDYLLSLLSYHDSSQRLWTSSIDTTWGDYYSVEFFTGYIRSASAAHTKNVRCVRIP